jgi:hypothetical protein
MHLDTTSIVEVILRLLSADEMASTSSYEHAAWLCQTNFMAQLLDCLCAPPAGSNKLERVQRAVQHNVGNIFVAIAHSQCSPMFEQLTQSAFLQRMLEQAARSKQPGTCDILHPVLQVCIALLDPRPPRNVMSAAPMAFGIMPPYEPPPEPDVAEARAAARAVAAGEIVQIVPHFTELLNCPEGGYGFIAAHQQPYGTLNPPLGRQRIRVVELGKALLRTQEPAAITAIIESDFVGKVMELFCAYPFNSILHLNVRDILGELIAAMSCPPDADMNAELPGMGAAAAQSSDVALASDARSGEAVSTAEGAYGYAQQGTAAAAPSEGGAATDAREFAEREVMDDIARRIQDCLFDKVDLLNWLMEMSENAESTHFRVCFMLPKFLLFLAVYPLKRKGENKHQKCYHKASHQGRHIFVTNACTCSRSAVAAVWAAWRS